MISMIDILLRSKCGELSYVCCLSQDQLIELTQLTSGMTESDLRQFYKVVCACSPKPTPGPTPQPPGGGGGTNPPNPPPPNLGGDCIKTLTDNVCSDAGKAVMIGAKEAVDLVLLRPNLNPYVRVILMAASLAIDGLEAACLEQKFTVDLLKGLCKIVVAIDNISKDVLPDSLAAMFLAGPIGNAIKTCCTTYSNAVTAANDPPWATGLDEAVNHLSGNTVASNPPGGGAINPSPGVSPVGGENMGGKR